MKLEKITPIVLTYNEAANISRTLGQLRWAQDIVIVDSFSHDETIAHVSQFSQVRLFQRKYDCHANQANFALNETHIGSEWVLLLDADYVLTDEFILELESLTPGPELSGYRAGFNYCVFGRTLLSSLYPPGTVLFRRSRGSYYQDGHTHRLKISGKIQNLRSRIMHDDRKPLSRWVDYQNDLVKLEQSKLLQPDTNDLDWADRLRRMRFVAPFAILFYCLFIKGLILNGKAGLYYSFQRMYAELLLSLRLLENDILKRHKSETSIHYSAHPELGVK